MDYVIWRHSPDETLCSLNDVRNLPEAHELRYGISKENNYPDDVFFNMDPELKRAIKLSDALDNCDSTIVASKALVTFFKARDMKFVEYLPVKIINHKKQIASEEYCIVNQISTQPCIDFEQSKLKWNRINPEQISAVRKLVIDENQIDDKVELFRAKHLTTAIFVKRALADDIVKQGFTGIEFVEIDTFRVV